MNNDFPRSTVYQAMMTSLFAGFISTLACLMYDVFYREGTGFGLSVIINVSSIIFLVNLLFLFIGIIYFVFLTVFKKADVAFRIVFILLTIFLLWRSASVHRTDDHELNIAFKNLLLGIVLIIGVCASVLIPILFHNKKFREHVL